MNIQVNAKSAAKSILEFVKQAGGTAKNTEALELVARICGFDSYRAMRAVSQRDATDKAVAPSLNSRLIETPGRVAFRGPMIDWELDENPDADLEFIPERRRGNFEVVVEDFGPQYYISIRPVGLDIDNYHGNPVLALQLEINDGVPCVHLTNDPAGEMLMSIFGTGAGILVRREVEDSLRLTEAPKSLYELGQRNGAEYLNEDRMFAIKNDTFANRTPAQLLSAAIAADSAKASVATSLEVQAKKEPSTPWDAEEAIAHFASRFGMRAIVAKFDKSVGEKAWVDVSIVDPEFETETGETVAGFTMFGNGDVEKAVRQEFVDTLASVAAYLAYHDEFQPMRHLLTKLIGHPNALELVKKCQELANEASSVRLACDAIGTLLETAGT